MKLLFDTCTFLWLAAGSPELSKPALDAFWDENNDVYLSTASVWEIATKYARGKLPLARKPDVYIPQIRERSGIETLAVDEESALYVAKLPHLHKDPFDRLLVAQAAVHGMTILTPDEMIERYAVKTLW